MADRGVHGLWRARLRWRLRGATLWPAFVLCIALDTVLLRVLPIAGETRPEPVGALLLAVFFNLVAVAVGAPLAGAWWRRRRRGLPRLVADDQAGTVVLVALAALLAVGGVLHRPAMGAARDDFRAQSLAVRIWVAHWAPAAYRRNIEEADTWKQGPHLFRTCVPGSDPQRPLCLLVFTDQSPPAVQVDRDQRPNDVAGAGAGVGG